VGSKSRITDNPETEGAGQSARRKARKTAGRQQLLAPCPVNIGLTRKFPNIISFYRWVLHSVSNRKIASVWEATDSKGNNSVPDIPGIQKGIGWHCFCPLHSAK
jgi:hypothetical protein